MQARGESWLSLHPGCPVMQARGESWLSLHPGCPVVRARVSLVCCGVHLLPMLKWMSFLITHTATMSQPPMPRTTFSNGILNVNITTFRSLVEFHSFTSPLKRLTLSLLTTVLLISRCENAVEAVPSTPHTCLTNLCPTHCSHAPESMSSRDAPA